MRRRVRRSLVLLYCNGAKDDQEAIAILTRKRVPHINVGPDAEIPTPYLRYGERLISGLPEIREFAHRFSTRKRV